MSLEQQLYFDISRCSYCPLGGNKIFCSPKFSSNIDTVLLLDSPNLSACEEANPWKQPSANLLTKALLYAYGSDLSKFHLTFVLKCLPKIDGSTPALKTKKSFAKTCTSHYLEWELKGIQPQKMIVFGELATHTCLPDHQGKWEDMIGQNMRLEPLGIQTHFLSNPKSASKNGGFTSPEGIDYIKKLHDIVGGKLSLPDAEPAADLFDFM